MKFLVFLLLSVGFIRAQADTEVYLLPVQKSNGKFLLSTAINISNNEGYDNQPSFYDNNTLLFAANSQGQTEIGKYTILDGKFCYITDTEFGSEYSPTRIPNQSKVSAIRLDKDGKQLLYSYDFIFGESETLVEDLVIGYHTWADNKTLVSFVLGEKSSLVISDISTGKNRTVDTNIGRSLHKIPNSDLVSYISKKNTKWEIRSLNVETGKTRSIINTIPKVEDMCWTPDGTIFMAKDRTIYQLNPKESLNWKVLKTFDNKEINNITRMTINKAGTYLGIVAEVSPEHIVQKQLDAYNNRDIEGFMSTFSNNIQLYSFPDSLTTEGADATKKRYQDFFKKTPNLHSELKNRIVMGNVVIDEEYITANDRTYSIVAMYEVTNGRINKARFIRPVTDNVDPSVIEQQNKAYNNSNLDSFVKMYDDNLIMANYPNNTTLRGKSALAKLYDGIFKNVKDLNVKIDTRIICGNMIIDEEHHNFNGTTYAAVSIYKIENGKIVSVTNIQE